MSACSKPINYLLVKIFDAMLSRGSFLEYRPEAIFPFLPQLSWRLERVKYIVIHTMIYNTPHYKEMNHVLYSSSLYCYPLQSVKVTVTFLHRSSCDFFSPKVALFYKILLIELIRIFRKRLQNFPVGPSGKTTNFL